MATATSPLCTDRGGHYPHTVTVGGVTDTCEGWQPPADPACGTTGCEAHDGECREGWRYFHAP